ncbi:hypothetical protein RhoFasB10_03713 [Rhodococcus sp. B10]|nr:hypothetical protein [Rhodococcus sp. B10]
MSTGIPGCSSSEIDEKIVPSVGPYALNIDRPGAHRSTSSGEHASPPVAMTSRCRRPVGSTDARAAGVTNACVTLLSSNNRDSSGPP